MASKEYIEGLLEQLRCSDILLVQGAAKNLIEIGEAAVPGLIEALKDHNRHTRSFAAQALGKIKDARAVEALAEAFKDKDFGILLNAKHALISIGAASSHVLLEILLSGDPDFISDVSEALRRINDPKIVPDLIKALEHKNADVRQKIVNLLGKAKTREVVEPLIKALNDTDDLVRCLAADALGRIQDKRAVEPLLEALSDNSDSVVGDAAIALGKIKDVRAIDPIINLLTNENKRVRECAVEALGNIRGPKVIRSLINALKDPEPRVRKAAANGLADIKNPVTAAPLIKSLIHEREGWLAKRMMHALVNLEEHAIIDIVRVLPEYPRMDEPDSMIREVIWKASSIKKLDAIRIRIREGIALLGDDATKQIKAIAANWFILINQKRNELLVVDIEVDKRFRPPRETDKGELYRKRVLAAR